MSKHRETAAERVWKEKVDLCSSFAEIVVLLVFAGAVASVMLMISLW